VNAGEIERAGVCSMVVRLLPSGGDHRKERFAVDLSLGSQPGRACLSNQHNPYDLYRRISAMTSNVDIQKLILAMGDTKIVNLDASLREIVASPAGNYINTVANLEPWDLICYTWITFIRRRAFDEITLPIGREVLRRGFDVAGDVRG
jgi:hypothetical protein